MDQVLSQNVPQVSFFEVFIPFFILKLPKCGTPFVNECIIAPWAKKNRKRVDQIIIIGI